MRRCAYWIAPYRRTAAPAFHRTPFLPARGLTCARCAWRMAPTKCTPKPSPSTNLPSGRQNQRRPRNIEQMPPFEIETLQALKNFVSREVGVSDWHAITQHQVQQFADATGDRQWIHLDREPHHRHPPFVPPLLHASPPPSLSH